MEEKLQRLMALSDGQNTEDLLKRRKEYEDFLARASGETKALDVKQGKDPELTKALAEPVEQDQDAGPGELTRASADSKVRLSVPGFDIGTFPNHLNRSSFIAPIGHGQRKFHHQTVMVTRGDCVLEYTGEQLDEADGDLLMALIAFAQPFPMGRPVPINRAELLRKIGRKKSKQAYEWLHRRIKAMTEATLFLEARKPNGSIRYRIGRTVSFRIVVNFGYDPESETYTYVLDPRWVVMFSNREYGLLDWDRRMQIGRGKDMAKSLQRLISTSSDVVQRYALDWLKAKMEYGGRMRKFREALASACRELVRLEIIERGRIEDSTKRKPQLVLYVLEPSSG